MHISGGNRDPPRRTDDPGDYFPPTATLLPAPLTDTSALVGLTYLMAPRLGFFTAPSAMETLATVAPFRRATGIPRTARRSRRTGCSRRRAGCPPCPRRPPGPRRCWRRIRR